MWLLFLLETNNFQSRAYCAPFSRYVLTWHQAVPLNAIIIGQNPYPNDIFPEVTAAMSYDSELAQRCQNFAGDVPPTVKVLANDLLINAKLPREDTISVIRDGWTLAEKGILLINNSVFHDWRSTEGYKECVNQTTLVLRLLEETEKHGPRTVQLFVLGDAAQRMASNICSWYKSSTIRISKKSVTHPAALSRRFDNLYDPSCHLGESRFSLALAELLRNHVAFVHTMSKRNRENPALTRQVDSLKHLASNLPKHSEATDEVAKVAREFAAMDMSSQESVKAVAQKMANAMETLSSRTALLSSLVSNAYSSTQNAAGIVSKAAPHETTTAPQSVPEIPPSRLSSTPVSFRKHRAPRSETGESIATGVSVSSEAATPVTPVSSSRPGTTSASVIQFRSRIASSTSVRSDSLSSTPLRAPDSSPTPIAFRSKPKKTTPNTTVGAPSENVGALRPSESSKTSGGTGSPLKMTSPQVQQLSCVESTLEILASHVLDDEEKVDTLELIQHDLKNRVKYNTVTQELCDAIDADLEKNPKFDLSAQALERNQGSNTSATLNKCKEIFRF